MALEVGDAVLRFNADLTQLNLAFDEVASTAGEKLAPAQAQVDAVGASFDKLAVEADAAAVSMKEAGATGEAAGVQISKAWLTVAKATAENLVAQKELSAALYVVKATGGESAEAVTKLALAQEKATVTATALAAARKAATVSTDELSLAEKGAVASTVELTEAFNMQEAKASIALIGEEIGVKLPRHVRGFVAQLPGVGAALEAAFSAVAIFVVIQVIVEATQKLTELISETFIYTGAMKEEYKAQVELNNAILNQTNKIKELKTAYEEMGLTGSEKTALNVQRLTKSWEENEKAIAFAKDTLFLYKRGLDDAPTKEAADKANADLAGLYKSREEMQQQFLNLNKQGNAEILAEQITHNNSIISADRTLHEARIANLQAQSRLRLAIAQASYFEQVQAESGFQNQIYELQVTSLRRQIANAASDPVKNIDRVRELNAQLEALQEQHNAKELSDLAAMVQKAIALRRQLDGGTVSLAPTIDLSPEGKALQQLTDGLRALGIQGSATWAEQVVDAKAAYSQILSTGQATYTDLLQAQQKLMQAQRGEAIALGDQKAADGYKKQIDSITAELKKLGVVTDDTHQKTLKMGLGYNTAGSALDRFAEKLREQHKDLTETQQNFDAVLGSVTGSFGNAVSLWVSGQKSLGEALKEGLAAEAATIAGKAAMYALYFTAWGIADLFWAPERSASEFAAAAEFAAVAAIAGTFAAVMSPHSKSSSDAGSTGPASGPALTGESAQPAPIATITAQRFAMGGLVSSPTLAIVGDAMTGSTSAASGGAREAIIPLDDRKATSAIANAIAQHGGGGPVIHVHVKGMISPDNLGKVVKKINSQVKANRLHLDASSALRVNRRSQ